MVLNYGVLRQFYEKLAANLAAAQKRAGQPLTLTEKILYAHMLGLSVPIRGETYVDFAPDRVIMQDATAQMALLQFMTAGRSEVAVPTSVHCDHLIQAKIGAEVDLGKALTENKEVYTFLKSVSGKYGIDFWQPGSGIIHQVALENYAFPGGLMIGTDSHTPNAGGLGMLAIGVGGADACDVMAGLPWQLKMPKIIGVKLVGSLNGWTGAKDVILHLAGLLKVDGGTDCVIEYFGEGAATISATGKATICNMGAEIGATSSVFPLDDEMLEYLKLTHRGEVVTLIEEHAKGLLKADDAVLKDPDLYYDQVIVIDLDKLEPYVNGPFTPDNAIPISKLAEAVLENDWPQNIEVALIGSCTNSSYQDLTGAASLVQFAAGNGISLTSELTVTPGSELVREVLDKDGYIDVFVQHGAKVYANACGPCIGQWARHTDDPNRKNTILTSFNRNFAKRNDGNPGTHAFVASPEIVTALAIAGTLLFNPLTDALTGADGKEYKLPIPERIPTPFSPFADNFPGLIEPLEDGSGVQIEVDSNSDRLQLLEPFTAWNGMDFTGMKLLIKAWGKCTTDHISMAGPWLKYRGHLDKISDNLLIGAINAYNGEANKVKNQLTGLYDAVPAVQRAYKAEGIGSVVIGGTNYGEGSSREHAAMEPRYLGVKAIVVKSYARIHETNLKKQGMLALTFENPEDYEKVQEDDTISITGLLDFAPGSKITMTLTHADGSTDVISLCHTYDEEQIAWFQAGSALNQMKRQIA